MPNKLLIEFDYFRASGKILCISESKYVSESHTAGQRMQLLLNIVFISGKQGFRYLLVTSVSFRALENLSDNRTKEDFCSCTILVDE